VAARGRRVGMSARWRVEMTRHHRGHNPDLGSFARRPSAGRPRTVEPSCLARPPYLLTGRSRRNRSRSDSHDSAPTVRFRVADAIRKPPGRAIRSSRREGGEHGAVCAYPLRRSAPAGLAGRATSSQALGRWPRKTASSHEGGTRATIEALRPPAPGWRSSRWRSLPRRREPRGHVVRRTADQSWCHTVGTCLDRRCRGVGGALTRMRSTHPRSATSCRRVSRRDAARDRRRARAGLHILIVGSGAEYRVGNALRSRKRATSHGPPRSVEPTAAAGGRRAVVLTDGPAPRRWMRRACSSRAHNRDRTAAIVSGLSDLPPSARRPGGSRPQTLDAAAIIAMGTAARPLTERLTPRT
jgi:hypothetical protein